MNRTPQSRRRWYIVVGFLIAAALLWWLRANPNSTAEFNTNSDRLPLTDVAIGSVHIQAEVAATDQSRQKGLSGRTSLGDNNGLLFLFDQTQRPIFWMKDMNFELDFIWIERDRVVQITESVPIRTATGSWTTLRPVQDVDAVLELPAGFIHNHQISLGERVAYGSAINQ